MFIAVLTVLFLSQTLQTGRAFFETGDLSGNFFPQTHRSKLRMSAGFQHDTLYPQLGAGSTMFGNFHPYLGFHDPV